MRGGEVRRSALVVIAVGLLVAMPWFAGRSQAAPAVIPCPHAPGAPQSFALGAAPPPRVLNPCPGEEWAKTYGGSLLDYPMGLRVTSDGGYLLVGYSYGPNGNDPPADAFVLRLTSAGAIAWQRTYGGPQSDTANDATTTADGGYAVVGSTRSFGAGDNDVWILKLDLAGNVEWQRAYGGIAYDSGRVIHQLSDGGYLIGAVTQSFGAGGRDFWLLRVNSLGDIVYEKTVGGGVDEETLGFRALSDGSSVLVGYCGYSTATNALDACIVRMDPNGNVLWQKKLSRSDKQEVLGGVDETSDGGFVVAGHYETIGTARPIWVVKLAANGDVSWQKTFTPGGTQELKTGIRQTADGGYVVAASWRKSFQTRNSYEIAVLRLDGSGNALWWKTFGGSSFERSCGNQCLEQTVDGGYVVAGEVQSFGAGATDAWVLKLDPNGGLVSGCPTGVGANVTPSVGTAAPSVTSPSLSVSSSTATTAATSVTPVAGTFTSTTQCSA